MRWRSFAWLLTYPNVSRRDSLYLVNRDSHSKSVHIQLTMKYNYYSNKFNPTCTIQNSFRNPHIQFFINLLVVTVK